MEKKRMASDLLVSDVKNNKLIIYVLVCIENFIKIDCIQILEG